MVYSRCSIMGNKPRIRFKGFTEDWEQRKLGEIGKWYKGIGGTKDDLNTKQSGRMFVHYADLYQTSEFLSNVVHWTINEIIGALIAPNSILFPMSDVTPYGLARTTSCKLKDVRAGGDVLINTIDTNIDSDFVSIYINLFSKNILPFVTGTTVKHINSKSLSELTILIPSFEEQVKIVNLVKFYNEIITLHQCKLEKLKLTKKALLQKLFPKNGKRIPEIRFKGFTDAWEQRNLESLFTKYEDKVKTPNSGYWRLGLRSHCKGTFHTYVDAGNELETAEMNRVQSGNFILNITFAWERALAVTNEEDQDKLVSHRFPQFKPNSDLAIDFFKHTLIDKRFKHHLELSSPGGAGRNKVLKIADMLKYELLVPSIKEQNEISSFLNNVDYIITLYQRKLDRLISIKKALLQQLFV